MTFNEAEQVEHRAVFIKECRQKAWSAACHAEWIANGLQKIMAEYQKCQAEDQAAAEAIEKLRTSLDPSKDKENRHRIGSLKDRREALARAMQTLTQNMQKGQQAVDALYQSIEASLQLAEHAETWGWKEVDTKQEGDRGKIE